MSVPGKNYCGKPLSLAEILDAIESSEISPDEIIITPPDFNADTDEDSGDEDCNDPNRLSRRQLLASATATITQEDDFGIDVRLEIADGLQLNSLENMEPQYSLEKITQNWRHGNEESLKLSSTAYRFKNWDSVILPPCTLSEHSHPLDFFEVFIDASLIESTVNATNSYAFSSKNKVLNVQRGEIYTLIGILLLSGYIPVPRRRMFWEDRQDSHNDLVAKSMRRNRFDDIFTNLHFCSNDLLDTTDKMAKVRPLINHINKKFLIYAPLGMEVSIDESMIPYFGRNSCKQFLKNKPVRFGYKAWVAAHPLGYCLQFDIYQGRNENRNPALGLGEYVVLT